SHTLPPGVAHGSSAISTVAPTTGGRMGRRMRQVFNFAWGAIRGTVNVMKKSLSAAWNAIMEQAKRAWNRLRAIVAAPVNFVIGVYMNHLKPLAEKVLKAVGVNKAMPSIAKAKGYAEGGVVSRRGGVSRGRVGFADGGVLPGYSPGKDNMIGMSKWGPVGLSGGEGILR